MGWGWGDEISATDKSVQRAAVANFRSWLQVSIACRGDNLRDKIYKKRRAYI